MRIFVLRRIGVLGTIPTELFYTQISWKADGFRMWFFMLEMILWRCSFSVGRERQEQSTGETRGQQEQSTGRRRARQEHRTGEAGGQAAAKLCRDKRTAAGHR